MKKIIMMTLISVIALVSCKKEDVTPEDPGTPAETLVTIGSAVNANNETVTLFSGTSDLKTGYNKLYVTVKNGSGVALTDAVVSFAPLMDMGSMSHGCPVEQPVYNSAKGKYEGVVVFTMASTQGSWTLDVVVNGNPVTFNLTIGSAPTKVVGSYSGTDGSVYIVSLVPPAKWNVGMNDVEIMINKKESGMSYPAENEFSVVMDPEMVSMGHGSPNNTSPVSIGNGHYKGVVNLTMTGDWRLHFVLSKNSTVIHSDAYLDILF